MISPESIDPFVLPSLPLKWQRRLTCCHGIYIAISQEEEILDMVKRPSRIITKVRKRATNLKRDTLHWSFD